MTNRTELPAIQCTEHGSTPWGGEVICCACNRFYQTKDEHAARYAPLICACGAKLMSASESKVDWDQCSARALCTKCYTHLCICEAGIGPGRATA